MAKLEHVSIWKDNGWVPITAEEAKKIHPGGTVSAYSGLFLCDLCEQYVTFTDGPVRDRYFRHAKDNEYSQQCPDYNKGRGGSVVAPFKPREYYLPIRLVFVRDSNNDVIDYKLEIGLPSLHRDALKEGTSFKIKITNGHTCELINSDISMYQYQDYSNYEYLSWRLHENSWNYLSVGSIPAKIYRIHITPDNHSAAQIWPREFEGIDDFAIFDSRSCKRIPFHASIRTNTEYYLLTRRKKYFPPHVKMTHVLNKHEWHIYNFVIIKTDESIVKKFLELGYRLDDNTVLLRIIWPSYVKSPHVILHKKGNVWFYKYGTAEIKTFPDISGSRDTCSPLSCVIRYSPKDRNQLIAAGRMNVLKYLYLWEDEILMQASQPKVDVQTLDGEAFDDGEHGQLPKKQTICISMEVDGFAEVYNDSILRQRHILKAGKSSYDIKNLKMGDDIKVYAGFDLIYSCSFVKPKSQRMSDDELYQMLIRCRGNEVECSHSIGALAERLGDYPKVRMWLWQCIQNRRIIVDAVCILKKNLDLKE